MGIEEALEEPAFWLLGGGAVIAEVLGWIASKRIADLPSLPFWQFLILLAGTILVSAIFATRG